MSPATFAALVREAAILLPLRVQQIHHHEFLVDLIDQPGARLVRTYYEEPACECVGFVWTGTCIHVERVRRYIRGGSDA